MYIMKNIISLLYIVDDVRFDFYMLAKHVYGKEVFFILIP